MAQRFDGKVALITGAGSGMGRATALRLAEEGASVYAVDVNAEGLDETKAAAKGTLETRVADLADADVAAPLVAEAVGCFGRLDVLGNIAGIYRPGHTPEVDRDTYRLLMAINLDAPFFLIQAAIPHLLESEGNVINIASNSAIQGVPYSAAYSATKGGIVQLTRSLAVEYLKTKTRFNVIAPAGTNTNIAKGASFPAGMDPDLARRMAGLRGLAEPEEIAAVFAFLASDEARSVTGAVYVVDNGLTIS